MISDYINIKIISNNNSYIIKKVIDYQQDNDISKFTGTCQFTLPLSIKDTDNNSFFSNSDSLIFKKNDKVTVDLGYTELNNMYINYNAFVGIINNITIKYDTKQVIIECEDFFSLFKKMKFNFALKNADIDLIFKHLVSELNIQYAEKYGEFTYSSNFKLNVDSFVCNSATGAAILEKINKKYLIDSHFFGNHIVFGSNLNQEFIEENIKNDPYQEYHFTNNSISNINSFYKKNLRDNKFCHILNSENLNRRLYNETLKSLTINTVDDNGNYYTKKFGDKNGDNETLLFFKQNIKNIEELAKSYFQREKKYQGFVQGSYFQALVYPLKKIGNVLKIDLFTTDNKIEETVTYYVSKVSVSFNADTGLKQNIYLKNAYKLLRDKELDTPDVEKVYEDVIEKEYAINTKPLYTNITESTFIKNAEPIEDIKKEQKTENIVEEIKEIKETSYFTEDMINMYIKAAEHTYVKNNDLINSDIFYMFKTTNIEYAYYELDDFIFTYTREIYDYEFLFGQMQIVKVEDLRKLRNLDLLDNKNYRNYLTTARDIINLTKQQYNIVKDRLKLDPNFVPIINKQINFVAKYNEILNTTYVFEAEYENLIKIQREIIAEINTIK